jgi:hypothetical protein
MSWIPGTKRQSRIGLLGQLLREPSGFSCSRVEPSLLTHMYYRTHPACSHSHLQGRRIWLQPLCASLAHTRCSSVTSICCDAIRIGLPPPPVERFRSTLADALVQFSPDLHLRFAVPHSPLLPPREPKPAHTGAISISSASSPQCRLISFAAFPLTVSNVLHARLYCSLGGSACSRRITTPLASRATSLHIVTLHAVQLLLRFQLPNPCSPGLAASLPRSHTRVRATWAYSCPGRATRAHSSVQRHATPPLQHRPSRPALARPRAAPPYSHNSGLRTPAHSAPARASTARLAPARCLPPLRCSLRLLHAFHVCLRSASAPSRAARRLAPPRARAACCRTEWRRRERGSG